MFTGLLNQIFMLMRQVLALISCLVALTISYAQSTDTPTNFLYGTRCSATLKKYDPVYIINGVVADISDLKRLDPDEIDSILILKNSQLISLYTCRATDGVVIITTKNVNEKTIYVRDALTGEIVSSASVQLVSRKIQNDTSNYLFPDSLGAFKTKKLFGNREYELRVSCVGYKPYIAGINAKKVGKSFIVFLERNYSMLGEAVVVCRGKIISCRLVCCLKGVKIEDSAKKILYHEKLKIYPNPAGRSQNVNIEINDYESQRLSLKLFSLGGNLISENEYMILKSKFILSYKINSRLAAGLYIMQIFDQCGHLIKSEKLILQ